jgi:hypothetical protein
MTYLKRIPLERVAYVHVAGGTVRGGMYHDTHAHHVSGGVLYLLKQLCQMRMPPRIMLERDDLFPPEFVLNEELDSIKNILTESVQELRMAK